MNNKSRLLLCVSLVLAAHIAHAAEVLRYHTLVVDGQNKIMPWSTPATNAFNNYLVKCWSWVLAAPNDSHGLPISFLYCAWNPGNPPTASGSENDVGEKIPNWVESARLYYQYTGDIAPLNYVKRLVDYSLVHGQTPANHAWPDFPVGTANPGDTEFRGYTGVWSLWDCHVDLAADIGFSMYRMYQVYGDTKYRDKAIQVADVLAANIVTGNATDSPWPYVINSQTGQNKSRYAASWDGALQLFDLLIQSNQGSVSSYESARTTLKNWLLTYPMRNGNWVDGHSDVKINGTGNWSTTCASDMCLYLLEHPDWDPNFMTDVPKLLKWIEDNFVNVSTPDGLAGQYHGAYVPAEQTAYMYRMGYQTARLGAQYAQWYEVSGDEVYRDRAYRCLTYNTYMMQASGQSSDGPTVNVGYWWSDCYGEATRMYYLGMGAVPEWAPPDQNHLLRSSSVVTSIQYSNNWINYTIFDDGSTETLRVGFTPAEVLVNGVSLPAASDLSQPGWVFVPTNGVLRIRHDTGTNVKITAEVGSGQPPVITAQPQSLVVNLGSNATFAVSAAGELLLSYQWYFNSTNALPGRTNIFLLAGVRDADAGWYSVSVSNSTGAVVSSNAQLVVNHPPVPASPTLPRYWGSGFRSPESVFLGTDPDGDSLFISSISPSSVRGVAVSAAGGWVSYTPPWGLTNDDAFDYTVADGRGGFSVGTASVAVLTNRGPSLAAVWENSGAGALRIVGSSIPYRSYTVEFAERLGAAWQPIGAVMSDELGVFTCAETPSLGMANRFYRVIAN